MNSGMGSPTGFLTLNSSESRSVVVASTLSDVLETGPHLSAYFLTKKAGGGICRRLATKRISIPSIQKAIENMGLLEGGGTDEE